MMVVNGENMDKRLRKEIHVHEHIIDARLHLDAPLENRYIYFYRIMKSIYGFNLAFSILKQLLIIKWKPYLA